MFYLQFNLTHHIRHLSFGHEYPGLKHPLDNTYVAAEDGKMFLFVFWMCLYTLRTCFIHFLKLFRGE